jgi:hypothetical protein
VFDYWKSIDADTGKRIEEAVRSARFGAAASHETPTEGVIS